MHTRAFQGLKRTFMHAQVLHHHILIYKKKQFMNYFVFFLIQNMVGYDLRHA